MKTISLSAIIIFLSLGCLAQSPPDEQAKLTLAAEVIERLLIVNVYKCEIDHEIQLRLQEPATQGNPEDLRAFYAKNASWEVVQEALIRLYASRFSVQELKDTVAFLRTPAGIKLAAAASGLESHVRYIVHKKADEHQAELTDILTKKTR